MIVEAPDVVPFRGRADDLRDMVHNLLDNALVHGSGTVRVAVRHEKSDRGQEIVVEVADEGMGMPEALKEAMFERFRRGPMSQGAGLGLAIVRQVARGHGGDVGFLSEPGVPCKGGTTGGTGLRKIKPICTQRLSKRDCLYANVRSGHPNVRSGSMPLKNYFLSADTKF